MGDKGLRPIPELWSQKHRDKCVAAETALMVGHDERMRKLAIEEHRAATQKDNEFQFRFGSIVRVVGVEGPSMKVKSHDGEDIYCYWFTASNEYQEKAFFGGQLEKV